MYYSKFRIQNFKGIKDTTVKFDNQGNAGVFAFVGLNESGKTTILEAIHSFSPDSSTSELVGGDEESGVPFTDRVPRHLFSNFTGDVSVTATVKINKNDKAGILSALRKKYGIIIENDYLPDEIIFERKQRFESGDFKKSFFSLRHDFQIKKGKGRIYKKATSEDKKILKIQYTILHLI